MNFEFELTSTPLTPTAGLAFVGSQLEDPKFVRHLENLCPHQHSRGRIPDGDLASTMIGLISVGKPHFHAVEEFREDRFFPGVGCAAAAIGSDPAPEYPGDARSSRRCVPGLYYPPAAGP
ncbi:hypothetical protein SAMN05443144_1344 [Fodinibius roseus]|uniref:Uncharacterized protein n=1 Tax=Fodinibius roseus TaxID=1194090 RepID=A0A1M5KSD8_9BACT|nr:hypothetical protein [Fodinibius roseus]SHG55636.1 hypothetical protein SAMN05443144_1344 [Fodinibius roseus]